jgi:flagellar basal body-associated protein FliL
MYCMKKDLRTRLVGSNRKKPAIALTLELEDVEYLDRIVEQTRTSRSWVVRELLRKSREHITNEAMERLRISVPEPITIQA